MVEHEKLEGELTELEGNAETEAQAEVEEELEGTEEENTAEGEGEAEAEPVPEVKEDPSKKYRDLYASANGQVKLMARVANLLSSGEAADVEEAAQMLEQDPSYVKSVMTGKGVQNPVDEQVKSFDQQYKLVRNMLEKTLGKNPDEFVAAYKWYVDQNPDELMDFENVPQDELVHYVMNKGQEAFDVFSMTKSQAGGSIGTIKSLKAQVEQLQAELDAQKNKTGTKTEEPLEEQPIGKLQMNGGAATTNEQATSNIGAIYG